MKKTHFYHIQLINILLCTIICIFPSCSNDDEDILYPEDGKRFEKVFYHYTVSLEEMIKQVIKDYGVTEETLGPYNSILQLIYSLKIEYDVYAITYNTITPKGEPTLASGLIYYPKTIKPKGVIEISPINKSKIDCGTQKYQTPEVLPGMMGYICIIPDLIGCGSSEEYPISYMQHQNVAIVSADMRKATEEFIKQQYNKELDKESILFGYSLGGSGIMALAREYQLNPSHEVKVEHVFAGGGAYEPLIVFETLLAQNRSDYAIIPNIIWSMNYYNDLNLDFNKIFKGELQKNYQSWCDGYMPISKLTKLLGTEIDKYFTNFFLKEFSTAKEFQPLLKAAKSKSLPLDWVPQAKIHLFHAKEDYYVPTICGDNLYEYLKSAGAEVEYKKYDASHATSAILMEIDFLKFLFSLEGEKN